MWGGLSACCRGFRPGLLLLKLRTCWNPSPFRTRALWAGPKPGPQPGMAAPLPAQAFSLHPGAALWGGLSSLLPGLPPRLVAAVAQNLLESFSIPDPGIPGRAEARPAAWKGCPTRGASFEPAAGLPCGAGFQPAAGASAPACCCCSSEFAGIPLHSEPGLSGPGRSPARSQEWLPHSER